MLADFTVCCNYGSVVKDLLVLKCFFNIFLSCLTFLSSKIILYPQVSISRCFVESVVVDLKDSVDVIILNLS